MLKFPTVYEKSAKNLADYFLTHPLQRSVLTLTHSEPSSYQSVLRYQPAEANSPVCDYDNALPLPWATVC